MFRHRNEYPVESRLPGFEGATAWINGEPLTPAALRGRVVLVCFGTYTCINWIHALPYVRAWADAYADAGLTVIGVQTPEFVFEGDLGNVRRALAEMDVRYPVVVDNDYAVWQAFANHYWPAIYIADADGQIRHHHFGEGGYEESEMVIRCSSGTPAPTSSCPECASSPTGSRRRPTGPTSARRRPTSVRPGRRLRLARAASPWMRCSATRHRTRCAATSGRWRVTGGSARCPRS